MSASARYYDNNTSECVPVLSETRNGTTVLGVIYTRGRTQVRGPSDQSLRPYFLPADGYGVPQGVWKKKERGQRPLWGANSLHQDDCQDVCQDVWQARQIPKGEPEP